MTRTHGSTMVQNAATPVQQLKKSVPKRKTQPTKPSEPPVEPIHPSRVHESKTNRNVALHNYSRPNFNDRFRRQNTIAEQWRERYNKHLFASRLLNDCTTPPLRCRMIDKRYFDSLEQIKMGNSKDIGQVLPKLSNFNGLNRDNYYTALKECLFILEADEIIEMRQHDMSNVRLKFSSDGYETRTMIEVMGVSNGQASLVAGDNVLLVHGQRKCLIAIDKVRDDNHIVLKRRIPWAGENFRFDVFFVALGIPFVYCHAALEWYRSNKSNVDDILFHASYSNPGRMKPYVGVNIKHNSLAGLNYEQRRAVVGILEAKCRPYPYILFGPPGTGKTRTLVEAIKQIRARSDMRVLICANSNHCANQIAEKLSSAQVVAVRLMPESMRPENKDPNELFGFSCKFSAQEVITDRVVVTTNIKCGSMHDQKFNYVFIDEAAHAYESETLVPISRLKPGGCLVLAGDPKQLGPVVKLIEVKSVLGSSTIERMVKNFRIYEQIGGRYDNNYITKLLQSYRCDWRILEPSNRALYDGELRCYYRTPPSLLRMLKLRGPLVFVNVPGDEYKPNNGTSYCNQEEADACCNLLICLLLMGFEPHQLSVITTYKRQKYLISETYERKLADVKKFLDYSFRTIETENEQENIFGRMQNSPKQVKQIDWKCKTDTVDSFQGDERDVVIISTVRTNQAHGFIHDPKRFNVALSRAKLLAIVVGHKETLKRGQNDLCQSFWNEVVAAPKLGVQYKSKLQLHRKQFGTN